MNVFKYIAQKMDIFKPYFMIVGGDFSSLPIACYCVLMSVSFMENHWLNGTAGLGVPQAKFDTLRRNSAAQMPC